MSFNNPEYLYLLLLLLPVLAWYVFKQYQADASLQISDLQRLVKSSEKLSTKLLFHTPFLLRFLAITLLIIVVARPTLSNSIRNETTEGIDIVLAMDISGTMLAEDLRPNRLEAAKRVATEFIVERPNDNIGLVVFAGESFTQCPLTTDHAVLVNLFSGIKYGIIEDGTAIGMGLANAVSRIKDSKAKSKVVILLTDGSNNAGEIAPLTAAEIAKTFGVRVYTIGVGKEGMAPYPVMTPWGVEVRNMKVEIDEKLLSEIAESTGGRYFRATDNTKLAEIYSEINKMEKARTTIDSFPVYKELFSRYAVLALIAILLELMLNWFVIRRLP